MQLKQEIRVKTKTKTKIIIVNCYSVLPKHFSKFCNTKLSFVPFSVFYFQLQSIHEGNMSRQNSS
jgi:hypothetical protein